MKENKIQIIKFCIIGFFNAVITYVTLFVFGLLDVNPLISNLTGYVLVLIHSFLWSRYWIFKSKSKRLLREFLIFTSTFIIAYLLQFATFTIFVYTIKLNEYISNLLGLIVFGFTNFVVNKKVTFKSK